MLSPEFMAIWDRIKQKTTYRVKIDQEQLMKNCLRDFANMPAIPKARIMTQTADINIENAGVTHMESGLRTIDLKDDYETLPDILHVIATESLLKRSDVGIILRQSGRGTDFLNNPQSFTEKAMEIITRNRHSLAIDGIRYVKLAGEEYYVQEIFESAELIANLDRNAVAVGSSRLRPRYLRQRYREPLRPKPRQRSGRKAVFQNPQSFQNRNTYWHIQP